MIFVREKGLMCNNLLQYGHVYAWTREREQQMLRHKTLMEEAETVLGEKSFGRFDKLFREIK